MADKPTFARQPVLPYPDFRGTYPMIRALPPLGYGSEQDRITKIIGETYGNDDLPTLRARFLQWILEGAKYHLESTMLEGVVDSQEDEKKRNALLILYYELPPSILKRYGLTPCRQLDSQSP